MVFPTFFNLSLNFAIRSSWSEPQSAPGLVFADWIELSQLCCKEYNQSDFSIDHLVMSMCRVFSCVFGRGYLLWPVCSLGKTLLSIGTGYSRFLILPSTKWQNIISILAVFTEGSGAIQWAVHNAWLNWTRSLELRAGPKVRGKSVGCLGILPVFQEHSRVRGCI